MKPHFSIVVAVDQDFGIGKGGVLPWNLPGDMKYFKTLTTSVASPDQTNAVVMGRKTWESIPLKFRPLPNRFNIVLTRDEQFSLPSGVMKFSSLDLALAALEDSARFKTLNKIFVIGGAEVFRLAAQDVRCQELFITHINRSYGCDCFFPSIPDYFREVKRSDVFKDNESEYYFAQYRRES